MAIDTFGNYGMFDLGPDRDEAQVRRATLVREDAALRPWLIGKALRDFRYTRWGMIKVVVKDAWAAALWSWRMSK